MFRLYSHFWLACRFLLPFCIIHLQKAMNVSAKITLLAGLAPSPSFDGARPSNNCVLVSKRNVFYELFEATLGVRKKHVIYNPFEALRGLRKWCKPARGTIFADTFVVFFEVKGGQHIFSTYKGPNFTIKYNGFRNSSRKSRIASENP